jgi:hypothetical protein
MKAFFVLCMMAVCLMASPTPTLAAVHQTAETEFISEPFDRAQLEASLGRKLKLKERIAIRYDKSQYGIS